MLFPDRTPTPSEPPDPAINRIIAAVCAAGFLVIWLLTTR